MPNEIHVSGEYQPLLREIGLDAEAVFTHPDIQRWRRLADRENCTLDALLADGRKVRLHVKRYAPAFRLRMPAEDEIAGHRLLASHDIPTAKLVAWGVLDDRRSFAIFEDLAGYQPADKLIESGTPFDVLSRPSAELAARLHQVGLHHRDLYLCHFMAKVNAKNVDLRLIDAARVRPLPGFLTRGRWIVKDLAQFWYSTMKLPISDRQRTDWLARYSEHRQIPSPLSLLGPIERKVRRIARHDERLNRIEPTRNISIPR